MSILVPKTMWLPSVPNGRQLPLPLKATSTVYAYVKAPEGLTITSPSELSVPLVSDLSTLLFSSGTLYLLRLPLLIQDEQVLGQSPLIGDEAAIQLNYPDEYGPGQWIATTPYS